MAQKELGLGIQTGIAEMQEMEVRKVQEIVTEINGTVYRKLAIKFDDTNGDSMIFYDKNLEHIEKYQRGAIGTIQLRITTEIVNKTSKNGNNYTGEKTTILIEDFIV